jgi:hypothetical protein
MQPTERNDPRDDAALTGLERRLAGWRPEAGGLDRDRMLYEAGRASARASTRRWASAFAASALVATGLGAALARERSERSGLQRALAARDRPEQSPAPPSPALTPTLSAVPAPDSYWSLTRRIVAGLDEPAPVEPAGPRRSGPPSRLEPPLSPLRGRGAEGLLDL